MHRARRKIYCAFERRSLSVPISFSVFLSLVIHIIADILIRRALTLQQSSTIFPHYIMNFSADILHTKPAEMRHASDDWQTLRR